MKLLVYQLGSLRSVIRAALVVSVLLLPMLGSACRHKPKDERLNHAEAQRQADSMNARMPPNCAKWAVRDHPDGTSVVFLDESACKKVDPFKDGLKTMNEGRSRK